MAKKVLITPISGSVEFDNGDGNKVIYTIDGSTVNVTNDRGDSLMGMQSSQLDIDNDATFIIPTTSTTPSNPPSGAILYSFDEYSRILK